MPDDPSPNQMPTIDAQLAAASAAAATSDHINRNMNDVPPIYRAAMPVTSDPKELAGAEKVIRQKYQSDRDQFDGNAKAQAAPPQTAAMAAMLAAAMKGKDLNGRMPEKFPPPPAYNPLPGFSSKNDIRQL